MLFISKENTSGSRISSNRQTTHGTTLKKKHTTVPQGSMTGAWPTNCQGKEENNGLYIHTYRWAEETQMWTIKTAAHQQRRRNTRGKRTERKQEIKPKSTRKPGLDPNRTKETSKAPNENPKNETRLDREEKRNHIFLHCWSICCRLSAMFHFSSWLFKAPTPQRSSALRWAGNKPTNMTN